MAKIGDFGFAVAAGQNAEAQNEIWGTPYYVAPERLNNSWKIFAATSTVSAPLCITPSQAGRHFEGETNSATAFGT